MFERRLYTYVDWMLVAALGVLGVIGVVMIFSATHDPTLGRIEEQVYRQAGALVIGTLALVACLFVDYRVLAEYGPLLYAGVMALLAYTLWFGIEQGGAQRWIALGPVTLQPSEFARLAVALVLASYYARDSSFRRRTEDWIVGAAVVALPVVLIAQEPDLGTAATLVPVGITILVFAGLRLRMLVVAGLLALLVAPVVWAYGMEDYQKTRIASFLDPEHDPRGAGYQQLQARITVGSGGLTGRGFLQGTQSQYDFLPVAHNDFIFSVLAEEQGFLGVLVTLALYLFVILRALDVARVARDRTGTYLVVGIMAGFVFQVIYNITMSAGLAPVKGLTLPLLSYGGSSIIATLMGFGLILNVRMRRFSN